MTGTSSLDHQMSTDLPCLTLGRRAGTGKMSVFALAAVSLRASRD
ncbi:hypothetical protein SAMN05446635_9885 [Burkholderia sp. OK233]|nr:hypothetical protein SAMN05446635_9885 [Burkholderia sp. OK233]